jgi:hypothetical protein
VAEDGEGGSEGDDGQVSGRDATSNKEFYDRQMHRKDIQHCKQASDTRTDKLS